MRLSLSAKTHHFLCKNYTTLFLSTPKSSSSWALMSPQTTTAAGRSHMQVRSSGATPEQKVVIIMGPTGCGKTKLSVDLASRFFPSSEIINSDKIQFADRKNVRHHLLGDFDSSEAHPEFTASDYRSAASTAISQIHSRRKMPFVVGGSNSYIYALLANKFNPGSDVFAEPGDSAFCKELRYSCCFIWVDISLPVLNQYLDQRVDEMLDSGMFEELAEYYRDPEFDTVLECGLKKAIGVPEFEKYFKIGDDGDEEEKRMAYEEAVRAIKDNSCQLAKRQVGKILRLRDEAGWDLKRVDTTAAIRAAMDGGGAKRLADIWERQVVEPSVKIVKQFLME